MLYVKMSENTQTSKECANIQFKLVTNFDFTFNKNLLKDFKGSRHVQLSTLDTTTASSLTLTAQFSAGALSEIQTRLFYLRKQY